MKNTHEHPNVTAARLRRQATLSAWTISSQDHELAPWGEVLNRWRPTPEALYAAAGDDPELREMVKSQVYRDNLTERPPYKGPRRERSYAVPYIEEMDASELEQRGTTAAQHRNALAVSDIAGYPASLNTVGEQTLDRLDPEPVISREEALRQLLGGATIFGLDVQTSREEILLRLLDGDSLRKVERDTGVPRSTLSRWKKETQMQMLEEHIGRLEVEQDRIARQMERLSRENPNDATFLREIDAYLLGATEARGVALQTSSS